MTVTISYGVYDLNNHLSLLENRSGSLSDIYSEYKDGDNEVLNSSSLTVEGSSMVSYLQQSLSNAASSGYSADDFINDVLPVLEEIIDDGAMELLTADGSGNLTYDVHDLDGWHRLLLRAGVSARCRQVMGTSHGIEIFAAACPDISRDTAANIAMFCREI